MIRSSRLRSLSKTSIRLISTPKLALENYEDRAGFRESSKIEELRNHYTSEDEDTANRLKRSNRQEEATVRDAEVLQQIKRCRNRDEVLGTWSTSPNSQVVTSASIMKLVNLKKFDAAVNLFWKFKQRVEPNQVVYGAALTACTRGSLTEKGMLIHNALTKSGTELNSVILVMLIRLYMRKEPKLAVDLFEKNPEIAEPVLGVGISLYKEANMDQKAIRLYKHLRENKSLQLTPIKIAPVLISLARLKEFAEARELWLGSKERPQFLYSAYAYVLGQSGDKAELEQLKFEMLERGIPLDNSFWACWWDCLFNIGDMKIADFEFAKGVWNNVVDLEHWTTSRNELTDRVDFHDISVGGAVLGFRYIMNRLSYEWRCGRRDFANFPLVLNTGLGDVMERIKSELQLRDITYTVVLDRKKVPVALSLAPDVLQNYLILLSTEKCNCNNLNGC